MKIIKKIVKWISITLLVGILGFIVLLTIWYFSLDKKPFYLKPEFQKAYKQQLMHPKIGETIPEYVLQMETQDLSQTQWVSLEELTGNVIVLYWFGNCKYHTEVPEVLGKLINTYKEDLKIFIINSTQSDAVKRIKLKYPELFICNGGNQHQEKTFCHSSSQHSVILDKKGKIVTYGSLIPFEWIIPKLINREEFSNSEQNILELFPKEHKMKAYVKLHDNFLDFEKCEFVDTLNVNFLLGSDFSLNCANLTGKQIYQLITKVKPSRYQLEKVDSTKFYQSYNFSYCINELKYRDKQGNIDRGLAKRFFNESVKLKIDSLFKVQSSIEIVGRDTTLIFRNINASH